MLIVKYRFRSKIHKIHVLSTLQTDIDFVIVNYKKKWNQPRIFKVSNNIILQIDNYINLIFKIRNIFWTPLAHKFLRFEDSAKCYAIITRR